MDSWPLSLTLVMLMNDAESAPESSRSARRDPKRDREAETTAPARSE